MSLTTQSARVGPVLAASLPASIPVDFPWQEESDLLVLNLGSDITPIGDATILTLNSDYTVVGGGYDGSYDMQDGSVEVVAGGANDVQAGDYIVVLRNVPLNQLTSFLSTGILTGQMVEAALDKQATISQQLNDGLTRSMRAPDGEDVDWVMPSASDRASSFPFFNSLGVLTTYTLADILAVLEAGSATAGANKVFAGPTSGAAATPTFRALVAADFTGLTGFALAGAIGSSLLTMTSNRLLGRTTGGTGAPEEITVGTSITFAAGALNVVQDVQTTASPTFKRVNLSRTDGDYQAILSSASRNYGIAVAGTQFQVDDITGGALRIAIDAAGNFFITSLAAGGVISASVGDGALGIASVMNNVAVGPTTRNTGAFTYIAVGAAVSATVGILNQAAISGSGVGTYNLPAFAASANSQSFVGLQSSPGFGKGAFTGLTAMNIRVGTPGTTGAGTLDNSYQIYIDAGVAATTRYGIYQAGTDLNVLGGLLSIAGSTPASAAAAGVAGTITWDASYVYVATAGSTWKRIGIATW